MAKVKKIEIYILTGFLGSGKTTLLQQLLISSKQKGLRAGVIINEIGKIAVDSSLIDDKTPLKELLDGCVCCTIQDQFEQQLGHMIKNENVDVIYIETTGVARPFEVFDTCLSPLFADLVDLRGVITVVDLFRYQQLEYLPLNMQDLFLEQIKFADFLILNKIDLMTEEEVGKYLFQIQAFNPKARIFLTEHANINLQELEKMKPLAKHHDPHIRITNYLDFQTFVFRFKKLVNYDHFLAFFSQLPHSIMRVKGFVRFKHSPTLHSFQYAMGKPIIIPNAEASNEVMVIIGYDLKEEEIVRKLQTL